MKKGVRSKWKIFITSYLPLYLWLIFSNINYNKLSIYFHSFNVFKVGIFCILVILVFISICEILQLFTGSGSERTRLKENMEISPESDSLMNYVVTYFTPLISFNLYDPKSLVMNTLLFLLIGLMYVGSNATYLNPVLGVFGFKIFRVTNFPNAHHIISRLSFDEIETVKMRGDEVIRYRLGDGVYMIYVI